MSGGQQKLSRDAAAPRDRSRERRPTRKFDDEPPRNINKLPPVPVVDIALMSPLLISGEMYIKDGSKWRLGEGFLSDKYLVFRITKGIQQTVQVQYRVADIVLVRILNFAQFFDHSCFEVHIVKVPLEANPGFPKLTRDNSSKKSIITFRCAQPSQLMDWIDCIDDASDGVWLSDGMMPMRTIQHGALDSELYPTACPVVGGPLVGVAAAEAVTNTGSEERTSESRNLDWSISNQGDAAIH